MREREYSKFHHLEQLSFYQRRDFLCFWELNELIEETKVLSFLLLNYYEEVLLEEISENEYTDFHYQIKYLIDDVEVSVNRIFEFCKIKFWKYKDLSLDLCEKLSIFDYELWHILFCFLDNPNLFNEVSVVLKTENNTKESFNILTDMNDQEVYNILKNVINLLIEIDKEWYKYYLTTKFK